MQDIHFYIQMLLELHVLYNCTKCINKKLLEIQNKMERNKKYNRNFHSTLPVDNVK